ncbi:isochorismatase family protein [Aliiglaciecola sp. M165]|uniref:isochorismatase family protein n=1 Tax=Aliiglaciecola sp. M165 TaxID=2593649 RepID=UPI00117D4FD2|nr:isochorismatase family protein [Aliiglaciecola sp. M165]TRY29315.1 isochorismatase family protein [Aliiglaciecola sp. M165]
MSQKPIRTKSSQILMVDVQSSLYTALDGAEAMLKKCLTLLTAGQRLGIPITAVEQNPQGLGNTVAPLSEFASDTFVKTTFSAFGHSPLSSHLNNLQRSQQRSDLILFGCEAHVCLLQTALDAKRAGYNSVVVWDACASRYEQDRDIAKHRLLAAQCTLVTTESLVFEWLEDYQHPQFKSLIAQIKQH